MKRLIAAAIVAGAALAAFVSHPVAQVTVLNYFSQANPANNDNQLVIGGTAAVKSGGSVDFESGSALKIAGVDMASVLGGGVANPVAGVAAGYKIARGVDAVTGTLDKTTGLATVVACAVSLAEDPALTGNNVTFVLGGTAGHVTLKVWKPTAANDVTPIAGTAAKNVSWLCAGT